MLRYDTTVNNVWHGFAMLVTTDNGSDYSTKPTLSLQWDATAGQLVQKLETMQISEPPRRDPHTGAEEGVHSQRIEAQQIHTYYSLAGGQTFWRWKLEIPLGEREEEIFYSVNVRSLVRPFVQTHELTLLPSAEWPGGVVLGAGV